MEAKKARELLRSAGYAVKSEGRLGNDLGQQLRIEGAVVNIFDKGTVQVQGKDKQHVDAVKAVLGVDTVTGEARTKPAQPKLNREVFVVYGHDIAARTQLEAMLRRWDLDPLILEQLPSEGTTLIEKLEKYARQDVGFGVVLATPTTWAMRSGGTTSASTEHDKMLSLSWGSCLPSWDVPASLSYSRTKQQWSDRLTFKA